VLGGQNAREKRAGCCREASIEEQARVSELLPERAMVLLRDRVGLRIFVFCLILRVARLISGALSMWAEFISHA